MAKPMPTGLAGCSARPPSRPRPPSLDTHHRPRCRRRPPSSSGPSSALLSLLATISASSTSVYGSPAPPSFLCPSLDADNTAARNVQSRGTTLSKNRRSPQLFKKAVGNTRYVPDKFEIDDSGRWRRVESYTLYGSTVCLTCLDSSTSVTSVDDQIQGPASSSIPKSTPSSTATYNIHDNLPPGWKPPGHATASRTTLILALSLVLAFLICFLIIGCLFWRKSKRRKRRQNDIEMKARRRRRSQTADDEGRAQMLTIEREVKVKKKIWARATARWKANARYTARQRRGKRIASKTASPQSSCSSLDRIEETQTTPQIPSPLTVSRRSSLESPYAASSVADALASGSSPQEIQSDSNLPVSLPSGAPSPPAYHLRVATSQNHLSEGGSGGGDGQPNSLPLSPGSQYSSCSNSRPSDPSDTSGDMDFPSQPIHAAHVATDDKTLLARLADLASAPPSDGANSSLGESNDFHVSVPMWQDEELGDFGHGAYDPANCSLPPSRCSSRSSSPVPLFPPPPSKGKMAATFYDYPYTFEDILVEPDPGPSAPPFEEESSRPLDEADITASAPPLSEAEAAYYIESHASAPVHDWVSSVTVTTEQLQDQETIPTNNNTEHDPRSPETITNPSIPLVHGPVASDGTPPCYHP